jgi:hypothetical protein
LGISLKDQQRSAGGVLLQSTRRILPFPDLYCGHYLRSWILPFPVILYPQLANDSKKKFKKEKNG